MKRSPRSALLLAALLLPLLHLPTPAAGRSSGTGRGPSKGRPGKSAPAARRARGAGRGRAEIPYRTGSPYLGAIAVNAESGQTVFEDNADAQCYPASIVKLMGLLLVQEKIERKEIGLQDPVTATAEACRIGGSQVYLREHETFPVEEILYALMVKSANDAAVALAIHVAGSTGEFVRMMQQRAETLGMKSTRFHTVHGLPPAEGQEPDITTPRDLVLLARELLKHPAILRYTSTRSRTFRDGQFGMSNHNTLLATFPGCDGLKTGYFRRGGYSLVATAERGGNRFIAVVAGAKEKKAGHGKAREILSRAFGSVTPKPSPTVTPPPSIIAQPPAAPPERAGKGPGRGRMLLLLAVAAGLGWAVYRFVQTQIRAPRPPRGMFDR